MLILLNWELETIASIVMLNSEHTIAQHATYG